MRGRRLGRTRRLAAGGWPRLCPLPSWQPTCTATQTPSPSPSPSPSFQFWYTDATADTVAAAAAAAARAGPSGRVACVACPSLFRALLRRPDAAAEGGGGVRHHLFEYDDRFQVGGGGVGGAGEGGRWAGGACLVVRECLRHASPRGLIPTRARQTCSLWVHFRTTTTAPHPPFPLNCLAPLPSSSPTLRTCRRSAWSALRSQCGPWPLPGVPWCCYPGR